jgi:phosphopantetheinyl transferase
MSRAGLFDLQDLFGTASPPDWLDARIAAVRTDVDPADAPDLLRTVTIDDAHAHTILTWRSPVRRAHWLAGRLAARTLADDLGWDLDTVRVKPLDTGAPTLVSGPRRQPISITHSGPWAMAAISAQTDRLGIDFEVGLTGDRLRLKDRICSRDEIALHSLENPALPEARRCETLSRVWVLKEAILKAYGVGLVAELRDFHVLGTTLDTPLQFRATQPLDPAIHHPLPDGLWGAVTRFEGHPLALVAVPP